MYKMEPCTSTENLPSTFHQDKKHLENESINSSCCANADSGYSSANSIATYNTSNISNSSIQTPSNSYNSNLQAISEKKEHIDLFKLTPITQNIRSICDFHITTPKTEKALTGAKRLLAFDNLQSTPKKLKLDNVAKNHGECILLNIIPEQAENIRPKKRKKTFAQRFRSAPDLDTYFTEDETDNLPIENKPILSPIRRKSYIHKYRAPLGNSNLNIFQASTPKDKLADVSKNLTGTRLKSPEVRKLINFTNNQFDSLINANKPPGVINLQKTKSATDILNNDIHQKLLQEYKLLYPHVRSIFPDREHNSNIQSKVIQEYATDNYLSPIKPKIGGIVKTEARGFQEALNISTRSNDIMDISPLKSPCFCKNNTNKNEDIVENNYTIKSNSDLHLDLNIEGEHKQVVPNKKREKTECKEIQEIKTPTKKKPLSIESESLEILYPFLPRTPSKYKNRSRYAKLKKKNTQNLYYEPACKKFYNGTSYLNIILKLEPFPSILEKIFSPLSNQDLVNVSMVSKNWFRIVRANHKANKRIEDHLKQWKLMKENKDFFKNNAAITSKEDINEICTNAPVTPTKPFGKTNVRIDRKRSSEINRSSPTSPSKRKFYENQKVVRTLTNNEILIKCPRCDKSSRIVEESNNQIQEFNSAASGQNSSSEIYYNNKKKKFGSFYKHFVSFDSVHCMESKSVNCGRNRNFPKSKSVDYGILSSAKYRMNAKSPLKADFPAECFGECASIVCKYRFCLDCLCDYHPGKPCKLSGPTSPSKEDIQNGILHLNSPFKTLGTREKRNFRRKSLKRLCFDN